MPFFFQRTEVAASAKYMMASTTDNHVTVLWAKGSLQNSSREFEVPIDSTFALAIFTLSVDNKDTKMEVIGPSGMPLGSDMQSEATEFTCGRYIIVKNPATGDYRVRVNGSGHFWLTVGGKSDIFLHGVNFVELGGRPGHQGMFPIHGEPIVGKKAHLEAYVSGSAKQISFELVTPEGKPIKEISLKSIHGDSDSQEFEGNLDLPDGPFRIVVTGADSDGHRFQRVHEALVRPTHIAIALAELPDLAAGQTSAITFHITNLGEADTFRLIAVCGRWSAHTDRSEVALAHGETASVVVSVSVPADAAPYAGADLVFTANSTSIPDRFNSYIQHLSLEPK